MIAASTIVNTATIMRGKFKLNPLDFDWVFTTEPNERIPARLLRIEIMSCSKGGPRIVILAHCSVIAVLTAPSISLDHSGIKPKLIFPFGAALSVFFEACMLTLFSAA
jgi:hypothetical protein